MNPAKSAKNQPIGIEAQIAVTPMVGIDETVYDIRTRVPREITVKTTDIAGILIAL